MVTLHARLLSGNTGRSLGALGAGALGRIVVCVLALGRAMLFGCLRLIAQYFLSKTSWFS